MNRTRERERTGESTRERRPARDETADPARDADSVQTTVGNRTLGRFLATEDVSIRELRGRSHDRFERDADRRAALASRAGELPSTVVGLFASNWGLNADRVRIGRDVAGVGQSLDAEAVTVGSTILFRPGAYAPERGRGNDVLAHELGHVLQHQQGRGTGVAAQSMADPEAEYRAESSTDMAVLAEDVLLLTLDRLLMEEIEGDATDHFVETFQAAIEWHFSPDLAEELTHDVARLAELRVAANGLEFDVVGTADILIWLLGLPPSIVHEGEEVSYGVDRYIELVTDAIGQYLSTEIEYPDLAVRFERLVAGLGDPVGILEAELAGIMHEFRARITAAGGHFEDAEIGALARQALLLLDEIENLRERGIGERAFHDEIEIDVYVSDALERLAAAETEERTRAELGDELSLLALHEFELETAFADRPEQQVDPEAAFPETTQRAVERMTEQAQDRVDGLARDVADLRGEIVPTDPDYDFREFVAVYRRWLGFFSPGARDADHQYRQMVEFYQGITEVIKEFGGPEGGFARFLLVQLLFDWRFPMPDATSVDFVTELAEPTRTAETTGSPDEPSYAFAELFFGRRPTAQAEERSRERYAGFKRASREESFRLLEQVAAGDRPVVQSAHELGLLDRPRGQIVGDVERDEDPPFAAWSYFLSQTVETGLGQRTLVHERREMPAEVGDYLLGAAQLLGALEDRHVPRIDVDGESVAIGDAITRTAGLDIRPPGSAGGTIEPGRELPTVEEVASALLGDLRAYFDEYIAQAEELERVAITYIIAAGEHDAQEAFARHFSFRSIAMAIARAIAMQTALFALRAAGPVGRVMAQAIPRAMKKLGAGSDTQVVMTVLGWINAAQSVSSFRQARVMAIPAEDLMDELGNVIQGKAVSAVVDFTQASWEYSKLRDDPLTRMDLFEELSGDQGMRVIMVEEIDAELDRLQSGSGNEQEIELLEQHRQNILENFRRTQGNE